MTDHETDSSRPVADLMAPTHTSASRIIDAQLDLHQRLTEKEFCDAFLALGAWTIVGPGTPEHRITEVIHEVMYGEVGRTVIERSRTAAREAVAYRVSPDMVALALHTADTLDESDVVDLDMAPAPYGFVRLDSPLPSLRDNGSVTPINWVLWYPMVDEDGTRAIVAWLFHDMVEHDIPVFANDPNAPDNPSDIAAAEASWRRISGRWHPEWRTALRHGEGVGPARSSYVAREMEPDLRHLSRGVAAVILGDASTYDDLNPARFLYGLWMLMAQPVTTIAPESGDRPSRRRAARSELTGPTRDGAIRLISLKRERPAARPAPDEEAADDGEWDDTEAGRRARVRWITRQHWRWQPYGPRKGVAHEHTFTAARAEDGIMTAHCTCEADDEVRANGRDGGTGRCPATLRRILIDSYVKGPEGAPLKMNKKVYDVS